MDSTQGPGALRSPVYVDSLVTLNRALVSQHLLRGLAHDIRNNLQVVALGSSLASYAGLRWWFRDALADEAPALGAWPGPPPRTMLVEFRPERAPDTLSIDLSVLLISLPVSPSRTSVRPPMCVPLRISPGTSARSCGPFTPSLPSGFGIFAPLSGLSRMPGSLTPWPPPLSSAPGVGGGGSSIIARLRPKRDASSSGFVSSMGLGIGGGVISYAIDGRQYVATTSGVVSGFFGGSGTSAIVIFSLPTPS